MLTLALVLFLIALVYSMVGFGGGSSYIAAFAFAGVPYLLIPKLALICNLLVVVGGTFHYIKQKRLNWRLLKIFVFSSFPMAYLGGLIPLRESTFITLLIIGLIVCALRLLFLRERLEAEIVEPPLGLALIVGAFLGLFSGLVGIGGGIFLSPILINMGWARSKNAAAIASAFILINSISGLAGQLTKNADLSFLQDYWPLFAAVALGGQVGSMIGNHDRVSFKVIQKATGILTLIISITLLSRQLT